MTNNWLMANDRSRANQARPAFLASVSSGANLVPLKETLRDRAAQSGATTRRHLRGFREPSTPPSFTAEPQNHMVRHGNVQQTTVRGQGAEKTPCARGGPPPFLRRTSGDLPRSIKHTAGKVGRQESRAAFCRSIARGVARCTIPTSDMAHDLSYRYSYPAAFRYSSGQQRECLW